MVKKRSKTEIENPQTTEWNWLVGCAGIMVGFILLALIISRGSAILFYVIPHMVLTLIALVAILLARKLPKLLFRSILIISALGATSAVLLTMIYLPYALHL